MKKWWIGLLTAFLIGLSACASYKKVHVYYDQYTDFTQYMSYYWDESFYANDASTSVLLEKQLKNAIRTNLQDKGYSLNPHNPDLLITIEISLEKKTGYHNVPTSYGGNYGGYGDYTVVPYTYYERTTILRLIDSDNQLTVWEGMMTAVQQDKIEKKYQKIEKNVDKILKQFEFRATQNIY